MLAYDEHGVLDEFVEKNGITVCSNCHRLYHQYLRDQVPGMREREYDECPYCGYQAGSSMSYDYLNSTMNLRCRALKFTLGILLSVVRELSEKRISFQMKSRKVL